MKETLFIENQYKGQFEKSCEILGIDIVGTYSVGELSTMYIIVFRSADELFRLGRVFQIEILLKK